MPPENEHSDREEQVVNLLRAAAQSERAPQSLRTEIAALRERSAPGQPGQPRQPRQPRQKRLRPRVGAISFGMPAIAAAVVALVLALGGGAGAPSLAQAAAFAARGPSRPAPAPDPAAPSQLTAHVGNLHFPNWQSHGGWRSVGQRRDSVGDRTVTTVYYEAHGRRIAYSIVSGKVLPASRPSLAPYKTLWQHGRPVVVWDEDGHTCLLSGAGISAPNLWGLAASTGA